MYEKIAEVTFSADLVSEGSWGASGLGKHESTMTLYADGLRGYIEWDIPSLDTSEGIGLTFERQIDAENMVNDLVLVDYDGVHSLPAQAVELLRNNGYVVPEDFE